MTFAWQMLTGPGLLAPVSLWLFAASLLWLVAVQYRLPVLLPRYVVPSDELIEFEAGRGITRFEQMLSGVSSSRHVCVRRSCRSCGRP